jgi:hypothetical protein
MWYKNRVWIHYLKNIIAADMRSAVFLSTYLRRIGLGNDNKRVHEVYDLQKYKVIRDASKVRGSLREKLNTPFIFMACKN